MAYVDKILIKGIRSFDPENTVALDLYKPLTLIVGSNGAGKTTVIESLRVACTGTLPPNARLGQSFVHDPKVAKEREVKAQIMVRFCNTAGDPFVVIRSFQLCQKTASMQFKAIDQTLKRVDPRTNETVVITQTCADMDKVVPTMMGVSRAVLDNVIFVHQDDSNWPLAEPKVLKEKFDLLFGTSKYTKWFEEVRKLKTEKVNELKMTKVDLGHLETHKANAVKLRTQVEHKDREAASMQESIELAEQKSRDLAAETEIVESELQRLEEKENALKTLRTQLKTLSDINAKNFAKLPDGDYADDVAELRNGIQTCDETVEDFKRDVDQLDAEMQQLQETAVRLKTEYSKVCQEQGRLRAEVAAYERDRQERDECVRQMRDRASALGAVGEEGIEDFVKGFENLVLDAEASFDEMKAKNREEDEGRREALQKLNVKIESLGERTRVQRRDRSQNELKKKHLGKKASEMLIDETDLGDLEEKEKEAVEKLSANRAAFESQNFTEKISDVEAKIDAIRQSIQRLKEERRCVGEASEMDTKIKLQRQEVASKSGQLTEIVEGARAQMLTVLGKEVEATELKGAYEDVWKGIQERATASETRRKAAAAERSFALHQWNSVRTELQKRQTQLEAVAERLKNGLCSVAGAKCPVESYPTELQRLEKRCSEAKERSSLGEATVRLMKSVIKAAESEDSCLVCTRPFTQKEKAEFVDSKERELQNLPRRIREEEGQLAKFAQELSEIKALSPVWVEYSALKERTLPELQIQSGDSQAKLKAAELELEEVEQVHAVHEKAAEAAKSFCETFVGPVTNLLRDVQRAKESLMELVEQAALPADVRLVADLEAELEALELDKKEHELQKDALQKEQQDLSTVFVALSQEHLDLKSEIEKYRTIAANKAVYKEQVADIERKNAVIEGELRELESEITLLRPEKERLEKERKAEQLRTVREEKQTEEHVREGRRQLEALTRKDSALQRFEASPVLADLARTEERLKDLDEEQQLLQKGLDEKQQMRRDHVQDIQNHLDLKHSIECCLEWRKGKQEEEDLRTKANGVARELEALGPKQGLTRKAKKLQKEMEQSRDLQSRTAGSLATLQRSLAELREELQSDLYCTIDKRYKAALIEKAILELGVEDLQVFHKACERALLSYHTMKMEEINAAMKELWRTVYKGSDIEYIQIKAEEVTGHAGRSHSYRLSMYINGSELEMRGRCSAGQKVLAGVIVRLALAETFCVKCGILTLDEPTTNLDAANVASLADALREIIESRQQQDNFQLIVITHDDDFARRLRTREHAEYMWRVTKDDRHHSRLTRERI